MSLPKPGSRFARFQVLRTVGRGAMGVVYLAKDPSRNVEVALKVHMDEEERQACQTAQDLDLDIQAFREKFMGESSLARRVRGPGVVPILDAGIEGGHPWYTSPFVPGGDLSQLLKQGPLEAREAVRLLSQAARGADAVHRQGIVHCDIKPANLMLDAKRNVHLTDFGMACFCRLAPGEREASTILAEAMGTPAYMSPEQAAGDLKSVCAQSDVYSLGAVLFEALSGEPPHDGRGTYDVLQSVIQDDPGPPSRRRPGVPAELDQICARALRKKISQRYPTAVDLAEDLEAWLRGERLAQPVPRGGKALVWVTGGVLLLLAVAALWAARPTTTQDAGSLVELARAELEKGGSPDRADALLTEAISKGMGGADAFRLRARARRLLGNKGGAEQDEAEWRKAKGPEGD